MVLEKTLESPLDCKEIQPVHSEGDQPWDFFEGMMLKLKLQHFGHLMRRVDSFEKTLMLGGIGGRRRTGRQRMRWLDSYEEIVKLAYGMLPTNPNTIYTVAYSNGPIDNPKGTLTRGRSVVVKEGMVFNVSKSDKS